MERCQSHDIRPILVIFYGVHLLCHDQDFLKPGAEAGHMLEVGLFLHLDGKVIDSSVFQHCGYLTHKQAKVMAIVKTQYKRLCTTKTKGKEIPKVSHCTTNIKKRVQIKKRIGKNKHILPHKNKAT